MFCTTPCNYYALRLNTDVKYQLGQSFFFSFFSKRSWQNLKIISTARVENLTANRIIQLQNHFCNCIAYMCCFIHKTDMRNLVKICNLGFVNNLCNPFWTDEDGNGEWSNINFFFLTKSQLLLTK